MKKFWKRLPKILKIFAWVFTIFCVMFFTLYIVANIYPHTWSVYKNEELGLSFRYPKGWVVQNFPPTTQKYNYDEEYLFIVSNVPFDFPGSETQKEWVRIIVTRVPKSSVSSGMQTLADENRKINGEFELPQQNIAINGHTAIRNIMVKHSEDSNKILFYWIDSNKYIYHIVGIVTANKPALLAEFSEYLMRRTVDSLQFSK